MKTGQNLREGWSLRPRRMINSRSNVKPFSPWGKIILPRAKVFKMVKSMKIMYWNIHDNDVSKYINLLCEQYDLDIVLLSEFKSLKWEKLQKDDYKVINGCDKVIAYCKKEIELINRFETTRYCFFSIEYYGEVFVLVGLHLPSNPHGTSDARKAVIFPLMQDLKDIEKKLNTDNTILIGDFNASPFDSELIQKNMFNAVLFKSVIQAKEVIRYEGHSYKRLYNPMLNYISEINEQYGSYYYQSGINTLVWYCYDQVLVRKPLIERIGELFYCKSINSISLLSKGGIPDKAISDHLPLVLEVS